MLHTTRWKYITQKSPFGTIAQVVGLYLRSSGMYRQSEKNLLNIDTSSTHPRARQSSSGCQPNFAALNRGCHLYSAGRPSRWALAHIIVMAALCNTGRVIIFLPCGFCMLIYLSIFFSSPNLSGRKWDVYHTCTHSVALVRI